MKVTPNHMCNFNRWSRTNLLINAVITMMDPRIICHNEAVMYNWATSRSNVHSRSHTQGMMRMANVLNGTLSLLSCAVKNCCIPQMKMAGTC